MQVSEYVQIGLAIVGLALITWTKVTFTQRKQLDPTVNEWQARETSIRRAGWTCIGIAMVLIFVPF